MTLFEYIAAAVSIVLSLSAAQLLGATRYVLAPSRRYWVHATWVADILFIHLLAWWSIWSVRDIATWTFASFALIMVVPASLYIASSILVTDSPRDVESWERHFLKVRRGFYGAYAVTVLAAAARRWLLLDGPLVRPDDAITYGYLLVGAVSANRRVQAAVVLCELAAISSLIWARYLPGVT